MHLAQYVPTTLQRSSRTLLRPLNSSSSRKPSRISIPNKLTRMILPFPRQWIPTQMSRPVPHKTSEASLLSMTVTLKMELSLSQYHVCPISSWVFVTPSNNQGLIQDYNQVWFLFRVQRQLESSLKSLSLVLSLCSSGNQVDSKPVKNKLKYSTELSLVYIQ